MVRFSRLGGAARQQGLVLCHRRNTRLGPVRRNWFVVAVVLGVVAIVVAVIAARLTDDDSGSQGHCCVGGVGVHDPSEWQG